MFSVYDYVLHTLGPISELSSMKMLKIVYVHKYETIFNENLETVQITFCWYYKLVETDQLEN